MAGIKITDLPAAPSAQLTDVFPVDQLPGPVTYKESNSQLLSLFEANIVITPANFSGILPVPNGGTGNSTFTAYSVICAGTSATGPFQNVVGLGASGQQLTSNGAGALPTWQASGAVTPSALTKVDDTNVTLTLGGTPATALLQATSITVGWSGTLSGTRGGTGVNNGSSTITLGGSLTTSGAFASTFTMTGITTVTFPTTGTLATTSQIPTGAALTKTDDTNVTLTLGGSPTTALVNAASLTLGWTGQLAASRGGTGLSSLGTGVATWLGTPSSANLLAAMTDETGTGALVFANTPTLVTPVLGVATATSINKVALTSPATSATLTIADGKTLTQSNSLTYSGTDGSSVNFGTGGTVLYATSAITDIAVQSFTATGTYTPTSGMVYCIVELVGGGGGGGGTSTATTLYSASAGGGAGGYARVLYTAAQIGASKAVTIGAAGTAGSAGNNAGGTGGTTSFGATLVACTGGVGGGGGAQNAGGAAGAGGVPTITTGTRIGISEGMPGSGGTNIGTTTVASTGGNGGTSPFGGGGRGRGADIAATAATGFGAGGSGSANLATALAGAVGTAGYLVVTEYI